MRPSGSDEPAELNVTPSGEVPVVLFAVATALGNWFAAFVCL